MRAVFIFTACLWTHFSVNISAHPGLETERIFQDDYQRGLALKDEGNWEEALQLWAAARVQLELKGESDPRIGVAFIELATAKAARQYYEEASATYDWGFSWRIPDEHLSVVKKAARRILPLLDSDEAERWQQLIEAENPDLSHEIRLFWLQKDPRPTTAINERLIEHWQRIHHARANFKKNRQSVYECDDRGTIYVKYGEPLRIQSGNFGSSTDSQIELMRIRDSALREAVRRQDSHPEYEVWIYEDLGAGAPAIFLFSQKYGRGRFGLLAGVEEAISRSTIEIQNRRSDSRYVLQLLYYAELKFFAKIFQERYRQIAEVWDFGGRHNSQRLQSYFFKNRKEDQRLRESADVDLSEHEITIHVETRNVRLLDNDNRPQLVVIAISSPENEDDDDFDREDYRLQHTLIIHDQSLGEIERMNKTIPDGFDYITFFELAYSASQAHYAIAAEARGVETDTVLAIGSVFAKALPPLNSNPDLLEVSDLVLGIEFDSEGKEPRIPLLPAGEFTQANPMQAYIEVYHLKPDEDGLGHFTIEFAAQQLDKKGKRKKKSGEISLTFDRETAGGTSKEYYGIDLSKLKTGAYELTATIRDKVTLQEKVRRNRFRVLE